MYTYWQTVLREINKQWKRLNWYNVSAKIHFFLYNKFKYRNGIIKHETFVLTQCSNVRLHVTACDITSACSKNILIISSNNTNYDRFLKMEVILKLYPNNPYILLCIYWILNIWTFTQTLKKTYEIKIYWKYFSI